MEALAHISMEPPDVIISDIRMPKMSGLDFAAQVKNMLPECIIIFLTGYQYFEYAQAAVRMGASDFLIKPVRNADLIKALQKALQGHPFGDSDEGEFDLPFNHVDRVRKIAVDIVRLLGSCQPEKAQQYCEIIANLEIMDNKAQITDSIDMALKDFRSQVAKTGYHPVVEKLLEYIQVGYHEDVKLASVAEQFNLSQGYLSRLIKAETGRSFTELLLEKRIEKAKTLLRNSDMRATDIAYEVGYQDYAFFLPGVQAPGGNIAH